MDNFFNASLPTVEMIEIENSLTDALRFKCVCVSHTALDSYTPCTNTSHVIKLKADIDILLLLSANHPSDVFTFNVPRAP